MPATNFLKLIANKFRSTPKGMASVNFVQNLESKALHAENLISGLKAEVSELQKAVSFCQKHLKAIDINHIEEIKNENCKLKKEIEDWKMRLIEVESKSGIKPIQVATPINNVSNAMPVSKGATDSNAKPISKSATDSNAISKKESVEKKEKGKEKKGKQEDQLPVDVGRLDMRVGKIINVKKHPDADNLYVEEVDLGEGKLRTVVSGLVKYVPIEEMQCRMVVALCNLKPAKMKGVNSEAMVLCASTTEKVEPLTPPEGSIPGDRITVEGYAGEPDPVLNPKKKIFETVAPDLKTNSEKVATYKGVPFTVLGKGVVTTSTLTEVQIK